MSWTKGTWEKNGETIKGSWYYDWAGDVFVINLDSQDPITGQRRKVKAYGEHPEFNGWKLVEEKK
jgi:hypothetical protein